MTSTITADTIVSTDGVHAPGWIEIDGDRIARVGSGSPPTAADEHLPGTVVPGFVDIHTHGAAGADYGDAADGSIAPALDWQVRHGTTTVIASLATATIESLVRQIAALTDLVDGGVLRGIHLEGPWLSPGHRGAHAAGLLRTPDSDEVSRILAGSDAIRMVTIAPELPGGIDAVRTVVDSGAVAAVGHTSGTATDARRAFDAGATVATHLFNGMPSFHHREPGPVGAALLDERVSLELILDGRHLAPGTVELVTRLGGSRVVAVSDAIAATGFADGEYDLAGTAIRVDDGVAVTLDTGSLAGSTRTLDTAFAALVREHGRSLAEAVAATSTAPARTLGLADVGRLEPGTYADLVLLDDLAVARVMRRGEWVAIA